MDVVDLHVMMMYEVNDNACDLCDSLLEVCGVYAASHTDYTNRLELGVWVMSHDVFIK